MATTCAQCGHENDDSSLRCVCGSDLPAAAATTEPVARRLSPADERRLLPRKVGFVIWAIGCVPLLAALRSYLPAPPLYRTLIGTGALCVPAVAALWFLGREPDPRLRLWRVFFVAWMAFLAPVLLAIVDGVAEEGWPSGRFNRPIARTLIIILTMTVPAFLTGLCALIRTYRLAGVLALVAGLAAVVDGVLLLQASWRYSISSQTLATVLGIIGFGSKLQSYLAIPAGIALLVGGIMTFRAARARAVGPRAPGPPTA